MLLELKVLEDGQSAESLYLNRSQLERLTVLRPGSIEIHRTRTPGRRLVEQFLEQAYEDAFGGNLTAHYPSLMSIRDAGGRILAAAGFRRAADGPLFLEQYLDAPIEALVAGTAREQIAEVGNLASAGLGASLFLVIGLAEHLDRLGCSHAAITATSQLARNLGMLGFKADMLALADPARLPDGGASWGRYSAADPRVIAGALSAKASLPARLIAATPGPGAVRRVSTERAA